MSAKHTPGPWRADGANVWATAPMHFNRNTTGIPMIATLYKYDNTKGGFPVEANARLIAAAPDSHEANVKMVAALAATFGIKEDWGDECIYDSLPSSEVGSAYLAMRAAIAKAKGE